LLKTFQRLGYFYKVADVPVAIRGHIASACSDSSQHDWPKYDTSSTRDRHMQIVRSYVEVTAYDGNARKIITDASLTACRTRDDLADIINVAIEELVRKRYELPTFGALLKIARAARARVNREFYSMVYDRLGSESQKRIDDILSPTKVDAKSLWDALKQEPQRPTPKRTADFLSHLEWLRTQTVEAQVFAGLPDIKLQQFAAEARSLDLSSVNDLSPHKRYALTAALIVRQTSRALDDITEMFIRQVRKLHNKANEALKTYLLEQSERSDRLIGFCAKFSWLTGAMARPNVD
jgi:hypothetical protein